MSIRKKLIRAIGTGSLSPRWLKICCFNLCMREMSVGFKNITARIDPEKITPDQRAKIDALLKKPFQPVPVSRRANKEQI